MGSARRGPTTAILGEEGADVAGTSGYRWLIDPIDGTTNYVYGHPGFAVSIACELDGTAVVGRGQRPAPPRAVRRHARRRRHAQRRADPLLEESDLAQGARRDGLWL